MAEETKPTSGESHSTVGRIAAAHRRFNRIRQVGHRFGGASRHFQAKLAKKYIRYNFEATNRYLHEIW